MSVPEKVNITVHAYAWDEEDNFTEDNHLAIHIWALNRESEPCLLRINDFPAFCYIEFPSFIGTTKRIWSKDDADKIVHWLNNALEDDKPERYQFTMKKKVYYYRGDLKYPMILMAFRSLNAMRHCENFLSQSRKVPGYGLMSFRVWESKIDTPRKLLTQRNVKHSQWFHIDAYEVPNDDKISTDGTKEYICNWRTMTGVPSDESKAWMTYPGVLAFDIECYSTNHKAMPNKLDAKHVAYMISLIYQRANKPETRKRYGLVIGDCNDVYLDETRPGPFEKDENGIETPIHKAPEKIPGDRNVQIISYKNEIDLINGMTELINKLDPEILTGYNIFGFDYPYLDARLKRRLKEWLPSGRILNRKTIMKDFTWNSGAYGQNSINYLIMNGRISVDLQPVIRRDYKYDKYTLDYVSKELLGKHRGKHDITAPEMFCIYESTLAFAEKKEHYLSHLAGRHAFQSLKMYSVPTNVIKIIDDYAGNTLFEVPYDPPDPKIEKIINPIDAIDEMTRVMKYCIEDSELVIDLFDKINVWIALIELSNIVGVQPNDLFTRGQQVRGLSQFYDLASKEGYIIDAREEKPFPFTGGSVQDPIPGMYENIICLDFASLYPSIIQAFNICLTTLVPEEFNDEVPDDKCHVFDFDQDEEDPDDNEKEEDPFGTASPKRRKNKKNKQTHVQHRHYKYVKKDVRQGLIPQLVAKLVDERRAVRNHLDGKKDADGKWIIPKEQDPIIRIILDKRQLALKVTANSFFGLLGVQEGGKLPLIEAAMCITAKGRELIGYVNEYIMNKYPGGRVVYGDTDSTMVDLNIVDSRDAYKKGMELSAEVSALFPPPLKMEFEKAMRIICFKKKKYAAALISKDGVHNLHPDKILKRGILLARRDNCKWARQVYTEVLVRIMKKQSMYETFDVIIDHIQNLLQGKVDYRQLLVIKQLGATYKSDTYYMKVFADNLRKLGMIISPGDRLDFLIVDNGNPKDKVGNKMRHPDTYFSRLGKPNEEKIDYLYYLEHALMNPIDQLFQVGFKNEITRLHDANVGYQPVGRHKFKTIQSPIKMIVRILADGGDLNQARKIIRAFEPKRHIIIRRPKKDPKEIVENKDSQK